MSQCNENILLMHQSPCPHSACCENPGGPYEEWRRCTAMEIVERIIIDLVPILSENVASRVAVTTHLRVFPYITTFSQRFKPVPLEATESLVPLCSTSSPLTPRFGPNSPPGEVASDVAS